MALDRIPPEEGDAARRLFSAACKYDPSLKDAAAKKCYEKFKRLLKMATVHNEDSGRSGLNRLFPRPLFRHLHSLQIFANSGLENHLEFLCRVQ